MSFSWSCISFAKFTKHKKQKHLQWHANVIKPQYVHVIPWFQIYLQKVQYKNLDGAILAHKFHCCRIIRSININRFMFCCILDVLESHRGIWK